MIREPRISLNQLVGSLSDAVDLVSPSLVDHHKHVAYIAFCLATELGISMDDRSDLVLAGLLHDIGAVSLKDRLDLLQFEIEIPHQHSQLAYLLLRMFEPLKEIANLVRCHHVFFDYGQGGSHMGHPVPRGSHILHLADRIAVSVKRSTPIFDQTAAVRQTIESQSGKMFDPQIVEAFKTLATREAFWLDLTSRNIHEFLQRRVFFRTVELDITGIWELGNLFRRIIDFRSPFTATHSSGVAASAKILGEFARFSESECKMLEIAGFIHDLGKLAVPTEVLELPRALSREEFNIVRAHTYFTYRVLEPIVDFEPIAAWGAFHHERLDGSGYPFHLKARQLHLPARIMAVADVFTAITEDRPYRKGMTSEEALRILQGMAEKNSIDKEIVDLLRVNFNIVNGIREEAQKKSIGEYREFCTQIE